MPIHHLFSIWLMVILLIINQTPINAESCNGATVQNGTNATIIDVNNNIWTITSSNKINMNSNAAGSSSDVVLLVYWNHTVYQSNKYGGWWSWIGSTWSSNISDPRPTPHVTPTPGCTVAPDIEISTHLPTTIVTSTDLETTTVQPVHLSTTVLSTIVTTTQLSTPSTHMLSTEKTTSAGFVAPICPDLTRIGIGCNVFNQPCDTLKPCLKNATCISVNNTYTCTCPLGSKGSQCQFDYRPCKPFTCWNNGTCTEVTNTTFNCACAFGWTGTHCELKINYCANVTCQNNGVCRPLVGNYKCECLGNSFSGRHCEITAAHIIMRRVVSKSCAYIAILAVMVVLGFVVFMDALKYCFGIDPAREELERIRRGKRTKKAKRPVVVRYTYVNA